MTDDNNSHLIRATVPPYGDYNLTVAGVSLRYGGVCGMTIYRWCHDPKMNFPKPHKIRSRNYWSGIELDAWDAMRKELRMAQETAH